MNAFEFILGILGLIVIAFVSICKIASDYDKEMEKLNKNSKKNGGKK